MTSDPRIVYQPSRLVLEEEGAADELHIVFDGFPAPEGPRLIEVENSAGCSINVGEWRKREDGLCELVIPRRSQNLAALSSRAEAAEAKLAEAEAALSRSMTAIDDWLHTYAPELCHEDRVNEARDRIGAGGTLAYIAEVQEQNRAAIALAAAEALGWVVR